MAYIDSVIEKVKEKDADQAEFIQAVTEVLESNSVPRSVGRRRRQNPGKPCISRAI